MKPKNIVYLVGTLFFIVTFGLMYINVSMLLNNEILVENYLAFGVFSLLVSIISVVFFILKRKIGFTIFTIGYVAAFATMLYTSSTDMTGWEGLIGLIQMMMVLGIGIVTGAIVEIILFFINKHKQKNITYDK